MNARQNLGIINVTPNNKRNELAGVSYYD